MRLRHGWMLCIQWKISDVERFNVLYAVVKVYGIR